MQNKVISRRVQKKDFSGYCKKKDWGFIYNGQAFWGYATKKQAQSILNKMA